MTFGKRILIIAIVVVGIDAVLALYSKSFWFDFMKFDWVSYLIYMAAGFFGSYKQGLKFGLLLGFIAGFVDSTLGWFIVMQIKPYLSVEIPQLTLPLVLIVIATVSLQATILSLVGVTVCKLLGKHKNT